MTLLPAWPTRRPHAQDYGTRHATREDEQDQHVDAFRRELSGDPPGDRSLVRQFLGWSYLLTAIGLALVTLRQAATSLDLAWPLIRNTLGIALHGTIGIAVDADKDWAIWPALALSAATLWFTRAPALAGNPLATMAALAHVVLLAALPLDRFLRGRPKRPA